MASADDVKAPQFPGGENEMLKFLAMNTKYPTRAQLTKTAGFVVMQVTIDETGKVKDIKAAHADSPLLDKEPLRVLKLMPRWEPALHKEIPVSSTYLFPFRFNMEGAAGSSKPLPEDYLTEISRKIKADAPNHPVFLSEEVTVTGFGASR
ncbi:hypothetical protein GCM10027443_08190 [Pontibacter brevis]